MFDSEDGMPLQPDAVTFSAEDGTPQECDLGEFMDEEHCAACGWGVPGEIDIEVTWNGMRRTESATVTVDSCKHVRTQQIDVFFP